jgi:nucleotide-binding universal stress UspA family protein
MPATTPVEPHLTGVVIALAILAAVTATVYWMLHPPTTAADQVARATERDVEDIIGSIIIVYAQEIHSDHMMALAARLAQREKAELLVAYVIEVPLTLPVNAEMEVEHREALGVLATAEAIARQKNIEIATEIVRARQVSQGVLDLAKRREAHLIVMGAYREGKYSGAPLGRAIEQVASNAACDVLIGVQGHKGKILTPPRTGKVPRPVAKTAGEAAPRV